MNTNKFRDLFTIEESDEIKKTKTYQRKSNWDKQQQRTNPTDSFRNFQQGSSSTSPRSIKKDDIPPKNLTTKSDESSSKKKINNIYTRPTLGKCFRCGQQEHLSNECPQRRALTIEERQEDDNSYDNNYAVSTSDEGDQLSCVVQRVLTPTANRIPHRNSLFKTRCTINGRPWQYDTDYVHRGRANTIKFDWMS
ncbi:hypothetical protein E6C27_scaffold653G00530 [Cucumis melo var. makuwa]|uniref:CCHC-type domain-containing protein n=1 Tax=Cucumis melo var. makuwa TaxID=1194695 RepID=A0A5A7SKF2_CUCMM|nr:hypothetical protein E6C27_scaffold653G00530 [Cucumis melo var. makuwa]